MTACNSTCGCVLESHDCKLVVITGGPGAGKTALLEMVRRAFCEHIAVLPEAASIVYGGGFPREKSDAARRAGQRAIYHVQRQLERLVFDEHRAAVALCDRGTLDGFAYWPGTEVEYCGDVGTTRAAEQARYAAVIHLRTPGAESYNHRNPLRVESAAEAAAIDARILAAWAGHPRLHVIEQARDFLDKVARALALIRDEIPACCRRHELVGAGS
jgi:predicted ATPase